MIQTSDNSATDHLLFHVGRNQVEAFQSVMGHGDPSVNIPFIGAREAMTLKFIDPALGARYAAADLAGRRAILANDVPSIPWNASLLPSATDPPVLIDTVEWFASAEEICAALSELHAMSNEAGLAPIRDSLALTTFDPTTWPYVGFKSGSEPGVSSAAHLLERCDGRWMAITAGFNDPVNPLGPLPDSTAVAIPYLLVQP